MKLDKRACRHAANVPLHISLNAGVLYTERVKYLVTAAVKLLGGHRVLAVYFYECERLKANDRIRIMFCCNHACILQIWKTRKLCIEASSNRLSQHALTSRICGRSSAEKTPNLTANLRRTAIIIPTMSMGMR